MQQHPLLQLQDVAKTFQAGIAGCAACVRVLEGVDLEVAAEECVAIHGSRGAGKSTLLLLAAGLLRPDRGAVRWRGESAGNAARCGVHYVMSREAAIVAVQARPSVPMVLLLEECNARTDSTWCADAQHLLERVRRMGGAAVIVSRDGRAVQHIATRVFHLVHGRLTSVSSASALETMPARVAEGTPHETRLSVDPLSGGA